LTALLIVTAPSVVGLDIKTEPEIRKLANFAGQAVQRGVSGSFLA
jgi:hypothetical protein